MDINASRALVAAEVERVIVAAWPMLCELATVYLYCLPATATTAGTLIAMRDGAPVPHDADLVQAERLPRNLTREHLAAYVAERAGRLPLLPTNR